MLSRLLLQFATLSGNRPSEAITDVLGIVAVFSFFGIACYICLQVFRESSRKPIVAASNLAEFSRQPEVEVKAPTPKVEENELEKLEKRYEEIFDEILVKGRTKLEDFAHVAEETFTQIANGYAFNSYGQEGENHSVRANKFLSVCERQWISLKGDIGYMSYTDVQDHLRHILVNHRMLDCQNNSQHDGDLNPELLRSQEFVALMRVINKEKVKHLQEQLLKAVEGFRENFQNESKAWINEQIVKLNGEMRPRKSRRIQITDTEYFKKFKQLKLRLEIIARLSDGITEKTQKMNEVGLALSQVIHVGAVLRVISHLPEWFTELEIVAPAEIEQVSG